LAAEELGVFVEEGAAESGGFAAGVGAGFVGAAGGGLGSRGWGGGCA